MVKFTLSRPRVHTTRPAQLSRPARPRRSARPAGTVCPAGMACPADTDCPSGPVRPASPGLPAGPVRSVRSVRSGGILAVAGLLLLASLAWPAPEARAVPGYGRTALAVAASVRGAPYAFGATGPDRFDCSGLTLYSFRRAGKRLPRTAEQQYERTSHISRSRRTLGDLVFFPRGPRSRYMGHVGIYAGRGRIWHAPRPGARVRLERIWTRDVHYGRAT
jgi:hypothetical protein